MTQQQHFPIAAIAEQSSDFERVLWTGRHAQLVVLTVQPGDGVGQAIHEHGDQVLGVVSGGAHVVTVDGTTRARPGDIVVVPRGTRHDVVNAEPEPLVLWTVYAPPAHAVDGAYATHADADAAEASGEDTPPPLGI